MLALFRARYTPVTKSPIIDAGDPQDDDATGRRTDIGAIDLDGHDQDMFGKFGTPSGGTPPPIPERDGGTPSVGGTTGQAGAAESGGTGIGNGGGNGNGNGGGTGDAAEGGSGGGGRGASEPSRGNPSQSGGGCGCAVASEEHGVVLRFACVLGFSALVAVRRRRDTVRRRH